VHSEWTMISETFLHVHRFTNPSQKATRGEHFHWYLCADNGRNLIKPGSVSISSICICCFSCVSVIMDIFHPIVFRTLYLTEFQISTCTSLDSFTPVVAGGTPSCNYQCGTNILLSALGGTGQIFVMWSLKAVNLSWRHKLSRLHHETWISC
jgi:hypothetical protein